MRFTYQLVDLRVFEILLLETRLGIDNTICSYRCHRHSGIPPTIKRCEMNAASTYLLLVACIFQPTTNNQQQIINYLPGRVNTRHTIKTVKAR